TLGGVQGAIAARLHWVLTDPAPTVGEMQALRRAFTRHLIRVDDGAVEGERLLRGVVPRAALPKSADCIITRLVNAGLLVTKGETIELAHERLINDWPGLPLRTWLKQEAERRRRILLVAAVTAVSIIALVFAGLAGLAWWQRSQAQTERDRAHAQLL